MATDADFLQFVLDQLAGTPGITHRKMFGEYALYRHGKVVAFLCDNQCFLKPTEAGRALLDPVVDGFPYPGAKPHFLLSDALEDRQRLAQLICATADALPEPKPRPARQPRAATGPRPKPAR